MKRSDDSNWTVLPEKGDSEEIQDDPESKKQRIEDDPSREVSAAEINELLEGISGDEEEGKTVSIAELNMVINDASIQETPKKNRSLPSCLSEKRVTSEKRIHFGKKATIDFQEMDPTTSVSPLLQRVESDISTRHSAITEIDYPEGPETSRNSSILAQFDKEPDIPPIRQSLSFSDSDSPPYPQRATADVNELNAILNDEVGPLEDISKDRTVRISKLSSVLRSSETATPRLTELLEQTTNEQDHSEVMDTEETVALQDLLEVAGSPRESSNMEISHSDSDTSDIPVVKELLSSNPPPSTRESIPSRRSTMFLGEVKSALLRELDKFERRSSMLPRSSEPNTDTLPSNALMKLLPKPEESVLETTFDLQQLSNQLRKEREEEPLRSDTVTMPLAETINGVHDTTEETLNRMSAPLDRVTADIDNTVTEDLRRLSQLLVQVGEPAQLMPEEDSLVNGEKTETIPHFSPLLVQSGVQTVVHEVKSSQKYGGAENPKYSVIDTNISRSLFQEEMKEEEREIEQSEEELRKEIESKHNIETSLNMDAYFLPSVSHSLLEDSGVLNQTPVPLESSDSSLPEPPRASKVDGFSHASAATLPSPILSRSSGGDEPSLLLKRDSSLEEGDSVQLHSSQPPSGPSASNQQQISPLSGRSLSSQPPLSNPSSSSQQQSNQLPSQPHSDQYLSQLPSDPSHSSQPLPSSQPRFSYSPPAWIQSTLSQAHLLQQRSLSSILFLNQHIMETQSSLTRLTLLRHQINEEETQVQELKKMIQNANEQFVKLQKQIEEEKERDVVPQMEHDEELDRLKNEEETVNKTVMNMIHGMKCEIRVLKDNQYAVMIKKKNQILARIEVKFIPSKKISLQVSLHPSILKMDRQRLELRLPIQKEWEVDVNDMKEMIMRCYWILVHSL